MRTIEFYLCDTLNQLIDDAFELNHNAKNEFEKGKLFGYYEIISRLLNQAEAFNISNILSEKVRDFNPETLLNKI
jgi:hypothetical protein